MWHIRIMCLYLTLNLGAVPSGELSLRGELHGEAPSTGEAPLELVGEGFGVRNIPLGMGIPRSIATGRGAFCFNLIKEHSVGISSLVLFSSNS